MRSSPHGSCEMIGNIALAQATLETSSEISRDPFSHITPVSRKINDAMLTIFVGR